MPPAQPLGNIGADYTLLVSAEVAPGHNKNSVDFSSMKGFHCTINHEDAVIKTEILMNEKNKAPKKCPQDWDVEIQCKNNSSTRIAEIKDPDATEYSSSFADTVSDAEICTGFSEGEVESQFFEDNSFGSAFDAFSCVLQMRKKKLTDHWRSFIRPVMWRCKWLELKIKEIESQALRYSRELAACDQIKHSAFDQFNSEESCSKSLQFSSHNRKKAMKRRKRKRVEDTTDLASYASHHNLFSYIENRRSDPDNTSMEDELGTAAIPELSATGNDKFSLSDDLREDDDFLEQVLQKIDRVHLWVQKLKGKIDVVMTEHAARFSSSENLSLAPLDVQTSSVHSLGVSDGNGEAVSAAAIHNSADHIAEYDIGDTVMPESVVSSFGEAIPAPDIIESNLGLLSVADVTLHQPQFGDLSENSLDNILMHDEAAEEEKHTLQRIINRTDDKQSEAERCKQGDTPCPNASVERDTSVKNVIPQEQSTLESCLGSEVNFPRNKRKRGERKAGSVVWTKRCSGEPDSQ